MLPAPMTVTFIGNTSSGMTRSGIAAMEVTVEGNPSGVAISNVSMIIGGTFTFDVTVDATSPAVGQLNFKILTSS